MIEAENKSLEIGSSIREKHLASSVLFVRKKICYLTEDHSKRLDPKPEKLSHRQDGSLRGNAATIESLEGKQLPVSVKYYILRAKTPN